jgi:hypothetical protein
MKTTALLARILIANIEDERRLVSLLASLPVVQNDPNWRCRTDVASALEAIAANRRCVGTASLDWKTIEAFARQYVAGKTADGRYQSATQLARPRPTWNLLENKEIVP